MSVWTMLGKVGNAVRDRARFGSEPIDWGDDWPTDAEALWLELGGADAIVAAARELQGEVRRRLAEAIGDGQVMRLGDSIYARRRGFRRKVRDPEGLADFVGDDWRRVFPVTSPRITALRAIAQRRGMDPQAVEDTFMETEWDAEPNLQVTPVIRAAAYAQRLQHGERASRPGRGDEDA